MNRLFNTILYVHVDPSTYAVCLAAICHQPGVHLTFYHESSGYVGESELGGVFAWYGLGWNCPTQSS